MYRMDALLARLASSGGSARVRPHSTDPAHGLAWRLAHSPFLVAGCTVSGGGEGVTRSPLPFPLTPEPSNRKSFTDVAEQGYSGVVCAMEPSTLYAGSSVLKTQSENATSGRPSVDTSSSILSTLLTPSSIRAPAIESSSTTSSAGAHSSSASIR
jgi:hypothetical protein